MHVEVKDVASAVNFNYYYPDEDNCNLQAIFTGDSIRISETFLRRILLLSLENYTVKYNAYNEKKKAL